MIVKKPESRRQNFPYRTVILNSFQNLKEMLKQAFPERGRRIQHDKDKRWGLLDEI